MPFLHGTQDLHPFDNDAQVPFELHADIQHLCSQSCPQPPPSTAVSNPIQPKIQALAQAWSEAQPPDYWGEVTGLSGTDAEAPTGAVH